MGSLTWRSSGTVPGNVDTVYAWLTDFTSDDHNSAAYKRGAGIPADKKQKPSKRTVLSREGNVLRVKDEWGGSGWEATVTLHPERHAVHIAGGFGYESWWTATQEGPLTRVTVEGKMGKGAFGSLMKLFGSGRMQRSMETDFNGHMEELREALLSEKAQKG